MKMKCNKTSSNILHKPNINSWQFLSYYSKKKSPAVLFFFKLITNKYLKYFNTNNREYRIKSNKS